MEIGKARTVIIFSVIPAKAGIQVPGLDLKPAPDQRPVSRVTMSSSQSDENPDIVISRRDRVLLPSKSPMKLP